MAESDEGVGSLSRRSERSLAWSAEYPPGQRRSMSARQWCSLLVGLECRVPSRTKENSWLRGSGAACGGIGVTSTLQDTGEALSARQPTHLRTTKHSILLCSSSFCFVLQYSTLFLFGVSHAGEKGKPQGSVTRRGAGHRKLEHSPSQPQLWLRPERCSSSLSLSTRMSTGADALGVLGRGCACVRWQCACV